MAIPTLTLLLTGARQGWKIGRLFYDEWKLDAQLEQYKDPEFLFAGLEDPYLELEARNRLVLAEYQVEREELIRTRNWEGLERLWRRVRGLMDANLQRTEAELKARPANLYHIAVLSSGLVKVAGEAENELARISHRIDEAGAAIQAAERDMRLRFETCRSGLGTAQKKIHELANTLQAVEERLKETETQMHVQIGKCESGLEAVQKKTWELSSALEALGKDFTAKLESAIDGVERRTVSRYEEIRQSVAEVKNAVEAELAALKKDLVQTLEDQRSLLQQMGQRIAETRRWFSIAVVALAAWLIVVTAALLK